MNSSADNANRDALPGRSGYARLVVVGLLVVMAGRSVQSIQVESVTTDEIMYIAAGYYHLKTGDFLLNATNTPIMKLIAAAPLLVLQPSLPAIETPPESWSLVEQWQYSRSFMYDNRIDADVMLFAARIPIVLLTLTLGLFVFLWGKQMYGETAGLFSLFLFSFSPNVLAHGHLATHDIGLATFMFVAAYFFWRFTQRPSLKPLLLCGVFTGLALLAKTSAIFLAPIFGAYLVFLVVRNDAKSVFTKFPWVDRLHEGKVRLRLALSGGYALLVVGFMTVLILNAGYGFQGTFRPYDSGDAELRTANSGESSSLREIAKRVPLPIPRPFLKIVSFQSQLVDNGGGVYFAGRLHDGGSWWLTVASCILKTPIALTILLLVSLFAFFGRTKQPSGAWMLLIFIAVVLFAFSFLVKVNANVRYVLSIYPCAHVLVGSLIRSDRSLPTWRTVALGVAGLWYALSSLSIHPHYLAYFNELTGGPENGYRYLADSNLDWGQDLKGLAAYMREEGIEEINLGFFGSADADYYGINYKYLPSVGLAPKQPGDKWWYEMTGPAPPIQPEPGTYAISTNLIASQAWMKPLFYEAYTWFRDHEPVDQVGYSILIYKIE